MERWMAFVLLERLNDSYASQSGALTTVHHQAIVMGGIEHMVCVGFVQCERSSMFRGVVVIQKLLIMCDKN